MENRRGPVRHPTKVKIGGVMAVDTGPQAFLKAVRCALRPQKWDVGYDIGRKRALRPIPRDAGYTSALPRESMRCRCNKRQHTWDGRRW